jgi:tRNA (cmo5U34)-methyltransferase
MTDMQEARQMKHTLDFFSFQSAVYDEYQTNCVPHYPELARAATLFLKHVFPENNPVSVLDLGCGTGNTARSIREAFPAAQITCLDGSEHMLAQARDKLAAAGAPNVAYCHADLSDPRWAEGFPDNSYDAVVSVLVLEHLPFEEYRLCLGQVLRLLKPSGWFVTAEGYGGDVLQSLFLKEMREREAQFVREGRMTQAQMEGMKALSAATEKHYFSSLRDRETWWIETGFSSVEFIWQYYCVAVLIGQKPVP